MSDLNRKQFEEWFEESGFYKFKETAWAAWEASRDCLVIELPEDFPFSKEPKYQSSRQQTISECRSAIHSAGVKTK